MPLSPFDLSSVWGFLLLFARCAGLFKSMPGLGSPQISGFVRTPLALLIALTITSTGVTVPPASGIIDGALMLLFEYTFGWAVGFLPALVVAAASVAGQVTTLSVGLGQANMIDPSLGEPVSVLSSIKDFIATTIFLLIDGHHVVLRAISGAGGEMNLAAFRPNGDVLLLFLTSFSEWFRLGITISAPILVTMFLTQFVLGLLTKFVPQVNVFILSLPLTVGLGLYMVVHSLPSMARHLILTFEDMGVAVERLIA